MRGETCPVGERKSGAVFMFSQIAVQTPRRRPPFPRTNRNAVRSCHTKSHLDQDTIVPNNTHKITQVFSLPISSTPQRRKRNIKSLARRLAYPSNLTPPKPHHRNNDEPLHRPRMGIHNRHHRLRHQQQSEREARLPSTEVHPRHHRPHSPQTRRHARANRQLVRGSASAWFCDCVRAAKLGGEVCGELEGVGGGCCECGGFP